MSEAIAPKQEWSQSLKANNDTVGGRPVLHENALKTGPISPLVASKPLKKSQSFGKLKGNESLLRSASNPSISTLPRSKPYRREQAVKDDAAKRLARKAELARMSRLRKKQYVKELEMKADRLSLQVQEAEWKKQLLIDRDGDGDGDGRDSDSEKKGFNGSVKDIASLDDAALDEILKSFRQNTDEKERNVLDMLERIRKCLEPGVQVQFAWWALDRPDSFYSGDGMWTRLCKQFGISEKQSDEIRLSRASLSRDRRNLESMIRQVDALAASVKEHFAKMRKLTSDISAVVGKREMATFYVWVEKNDWMLQILDDVLDDDAG